MTLLFVGVLLRACVGVGCVHPSYAEVGCVVNKIHPLSKKSIIFPHPSSRSRPDQGRATGRRRHRLGRRLDLTVTAIRSSSSSGLLNSTMLSSLLLCSPSVFLSWSVGGGVLLRGDVLLGDDEPRLMMLQLEYNLGTKHILHPERKYMPVSVFYWSLVKYKCRYLQSEKQSVNPIAATIYFVEEGRKRRGATPRPRDGGTGASGSEV